jgi:prophage regulatory protein
MAQAILRLPAVKSITGMARSTIYLRIKEGTFPAPVKLGVRSVGWLESEVSLWLQQRIEQSRTGNPGGQG